MAIVYSKLQIIERIRRHIADGWPANTMAVSQNEVLLYIDAAIAQRIVGHAYDNAKVEGTLAVAEGYLVTFALAVPTYDTTTGEYVTALPHPPISLPLGYSVVDVYFGGAKGKSQSVSLVKANRASYRNLMPAPNGILGKVEGSTLKLWTSNGQPLNPAVNTLYVTMPTARTVNVTDPMNLPDDDIAFVFDTVVKQIMQRMGIPKDTVQDNLTSGVKTP